MAISWSFTVLCPTLNVHVVTCRRSWKIPTVPTPASKKRIEPKWATPEDQLLWAQIEKEERWQRSQNEYTIVCKNFKGHLGPDWSLQSRADSSHCKMVTPQVKAWCCKHNATNRTKKITYTWMHQAPNAAKKITSTEIHQFACMSIWGPDTNRPWNAIEVLFVFKSVLRPESRFHYWSIGGSKTDKVLFPVMHFLGRLGGSKSLEQEKNFGRTELRTNNNMLDKQLLGGSK